MARLEAACAASRLLRLLRVLGPPFANPAAVAPDLRGHAKPRATPEIPIPTWLRRAGDQESIPPHGLETPLVRIWLVPDAPTAPSCAVLGGAQKLPQEAAVTGTDNPLHAESEARERAEEDLRTSKKQFQQLVADVQDYAIFLLDPQGYVLSWNAGAERVKGYQPDEIIGRHFSRFYTPHDAEAGLPERGLQIAKKQGRFEDEGWRVRKDGTRFWASVVVTALRDESTNLRGFLKITRDLTERKLSEDELHQANAELESRLRKRAEDLARANAALREEIAQRQRDEATLRRQADLLEQTYDPIIVWKLDGPIVGWNRAAEELYGFSKQDALGTVSHDLLHTVFPQGRADFEERLAHDGQWAGELQHITKNGAHAFIETRMRVITEPGGQRLVLEVNRDITERKQAEQEIRHLNENLERLVHERTTQLQEVVESLQAFSYSVSHDLRAPLRNVQTLAQALLDDYGDRLDANGKDYAQRLTVSARHMDFLIRDLLSFSRLTRAELTLQSVGLEGVVAEAQRELDADVAHRDADVTVQGPLPAVAAHRATLVQVVKNLLANALKFVEPGVRPRVHIWAEKRAGRVRLWVADNGIGIAPEHQTRIFRVFERLHGEESYPGTGIGLAIVQRGVERMGGTGGVESELGHGSRFWVELPEA